MISPKDAQWLEFNYRWEPIYDKSPSGFILSDWVTEPTPLDCTKALVRALRRDRYLLKIAARLAIMVLCIMLLLFLATYLIGDGHDIHSLPTESESNSKANQGPSSDPRRGP